MLENLRKYRNILNLRQEDVSQKTGVNVSKICLIENGLRLKEDDTNRIKLEKFIREIEPEAQKRAAEIAGITI